MRPVPARYENGALLPAKPLPLRPGEQVMVVVVKQADPSRRSLVRLAASASEDEPLAQAALDGFASLDDPERSLDAQVESLTASGFIEPALESPKGPLPAPARSKGALARFLRDRE